MHCCESVSRNSTFDADSYNNSALAAVVAAVDITDNTQSAGDVMV